MISLGSITFSGAYAELCVSYIEYKRSIGYDYGRRRVDAFRRLCDYLSKLSPDNIALTRELVEGYIQRKPGELASTQENRVYDIRQFGIYLSSLGYQSYLPPYDCIKKDKSFVPYIYTKDEIKRIIQATKSLSYEYHAPSSNLVYPLLN